MRWTALALLSSLSLAGCPSHPSKSCTADADCSSGALCDVSGQCVGPGSCTGNSDCPSGQLCDINGACEALADGGQPYEGPDGGVVCICEPGDDAGVVLCPPNDGGTEAICSSHPGTGFEITVTPPTRFTAGQDFNRLDVSLTMNNQTMQAQTITTSTPGPYVELAIVDGPDFTSATIAAYLELNETQVAGQILPPKAIDQGQLTPVTIDLSAQ